MSDLICVRTIHIAPDYVHFLDMPIMATPSVGLSAKQYALVGQILRANSSYDGSHQRSEVLDLTTTTAS